MRFPARWFRSDPTRLSLLLHDDFEEFGKSGKRFSKSDIVDEVPTWKYNPIEIHGLECLQLSTEAILLKYKSLSNGVSANRCSVWVNGSNGWQMIFHQGTPC